MGNFSGSTDRLPRQAQLKAHSQECRPFTAAMPAATSMSETEELSERVAKLEAWVECVMRTLSGMQVEPVLIELDEARRAYDEEDE
jgi:hypothetical protein